MTKQDKPAPVYIYRKHRIHPTKTKVGDLISFGPSNEIYKVTQKPKRVKGSPKGFYQWLAWPMREDRK